MKRKTIFFVVVLALCGCQPSPVPSTPTPTPTPSASASPLASVSPTPKEEIFLLPPFNAKMVDAVVSGRKAISESAQLRIYECALADLVAREKWNELESIVKSQRKKLQQFRSGIYKLTSFYYVQLSYDEHPKYGLNLRTRGGGFSKDVPHGESCKV